MIRFLATFNAHFDNSDTKFTFKLLPKEQSNIFIYNLLSTQDMPKDFYEISHLLRQNEAKENNKKIKEIAQVVIPIAFSVSQNNTLLWICSKRHASFGYLLFNRDPKYRCKVIRGSSRQENPYELLEMQWGTTGGSNDEHILQLDINA